MYLVRLPQDQPVQWLLVRADPRAEGFPYPVEERVETEGAAAAGDPARLNLTQHRSDRFRFKLVEGRGASPDAGCDPLPGASLLPSSWTAYEAAVHKPSSVLPNPAEHEAQRRGHVPHDTGTRPKEGSLPQQTEER